MIMTTQILIGIDDTDNEETHGTGRRARQLGDRLAADGLAEIDGVTRHQLLVDPRIPYTSHNSSACLLARTTTDRLPDLIAAALLCCVKARPVRCGLRALPPASDGTQQDLDSAPSARY
jgi:hypothetical protein